MADAAYAAATRAFDSCHGVRIRGPAFQGVRWDDPDAWAAEARPCTRRGCDERGECDGRETAMAAVLAALGLVAAVGFGARRMRRVDGAGT